MSRPSAHSDERSASEAALGALLARRLEADAATLAASLPAAIVLAVHACLHRARSDRVPPYRSGLPRIVLPATQLVRIGAPVDQLLRMAGARPDLVGAVDGCTTLEVADALEHGAAGLYLVHEDARLRQGIDLPSFLACCRAADVPSLVVDAASGNWIGWLDAGADLVLLEAARGLGGPEAGVILGREPLVAACLARWRGFGAPFRASTETVRALSAAFVTWSPRDPRPPADTAWVGSA